MSDLISRKAVMEELLAIQDVTYMSTCLTVDECKGKQWMIARAIDAVKDAPTVDAVEVDALEAWLYEIAMNNIDNYLGDACEEIISRLEGLRVFARERKEVSE